MPTPISCRFLSLVFLALLLGNSLPAQGAPSLNSRENQDQKTMYAEVFGAYHWGLARGEEYGTGETVALGYRLLPSLFFHGEAGHCHFKIRKEHDKVQADGAFFNALVRYHVLETRLATLFVEGGLGIMTCNRKIPANAMETNTSPQAGVGLLIPLYQKTGLVLGWRYVHLSHGLWKNHIANPGFNSSGVYGGIHWEF